MHTLKIIERLWREVRAGIPRYGRSPKHLVGYLAEFLFKQKFENHLDRIHAFFTAVGQLYPPTSTADRVAAGQ